MAKVNVPLDLKGSLSGFSIYREFFPSVVSIPWLSTREAIPSQQLELSLSRVPGNNAFPLLLTVGIQLGRVGAAGSITAVKRTANGKILAVV
jgi:hypothetical protein